MPLGEGDPDEPGGERGAPP